MVDSNLRRRRPSPAKPATVSPKKEDSLPPSNRPSAATATRYVISGAALALSVIVLLYYLRNFHFPPPATPYILCSLPGTQQIYTVDHDDSKVECMAVRGNFIVDTGAYGMLHEPFDLSKISRGSCSQPTSQVGIHLTNRFISSLAQLSYQDLQVNPIPSIISITSQSYR